MKHILYSALTILLSNSLTAQSNTVATGGDASGSGGSASYTVGQIDYVNNTGSNGSENQGVQQPYEFFTVSLSDIDGITFNLFPNPTHDELIINAEGDLSGYRYQLTDMNGKLLMTESLSEQETQLDLRHLPSAGYHLIIIKEEQQLHTYKIVKH